MINIKEVESNGEIIEMVELVDDLGNATSMTKEYYDSLPKTFGGSIQPIRSHQRREMTYE